jgi:transcription elongation factor SPT6
MAPFLGKDMQSGDVPAVMALSWGKGDPQKDAISIVFLDDSGRLREHTQLDNLVDDVNKTDLENLIKRRRPDVIVVGGFSIATANLSHRVKELLRPADTTGDFGSSDSPSIDVVYVYDEVARIYQHSKRAEEEFSALSPLAKYCVGLARYVQSPLNEYAALGSDITAITFNEDYQQMASYLPLLAH